MAASRDILRRLRSVKNTKKITKAMELVASAKMRKVAQAVLASRPYTDHAWELLLNLAKRTDPSKHPLLQDRSEVKTIGLVVMTSNRGLVGALNSNLVNAAVKAARELTGATGAEVKVILLGTKGRAMVTQYRFTAAAEFTKQEIASSVREIRPIAKMVIDDFRKGMYDKIVVAYMDYVSTLLQKPRVKQILPLSAAGFMSGVAGLAESAERANIVAEEAAEEKHFEYLFEPNPDTVLEEVLPRLVEMQLYRAVLEANASEQAARMMAMRNATDAAGELIDDLTLSYNQARQAAITQDLAEISAGRAALES